MLVAQIASMSLLYAWLRRQEPVPRLLRHALPVTAACALTIAFALLLGDAQFWLRASLVLVVGLSLLWFMRASRLRDGEPVERAADQAAARTPRVNASGRSAFGPVA